MDFIIRVPKVKVIQNGKVIRQIDTIREYSDDEDRVRLECAEQIPEFKRGYICDLEVIFDVVNEGSVKVGNHTEIIKDVLLVYINKDSGLDSMPTFENVFYRN